MKLFRNFFLMLSIQISMIAFSQDKIETQVKDPSALIEQVNLHSKKTTSITADFTQVKEMSFMEEEVKSSGKFYFNSDGHLRWEYTVPFSYTIIINGDRIRIIDEGKSKDFESGSNRMFLEISKVMTGMVDGTLLSSSQFSTAWFEAAGYYKAILIPEETTLKEYLARIEIRINNRDYTVEELRMYERSGDHTQIIFRNKLLNETIPADIFRLD